MNIQPLVKTDLNLLVTLHVILEEESVTKAADRLYVTQSAVSRSLAKLRELLNDPLFTRSGHQLVPTPFLKGIAPALLATMNDALSVLQPLEFEPAQWQGTIKIGLSESMDIALVHRLIGYTQKHAPGISIETSHFVGSALDHLASGDLDILIHLKFSNYPDEYDVQSLLTASSAIMARADHPLKGPEHPLDTFTQYPQIKLKLPDRQYIQVVNALSHQRDRLLEWDSAFETESLLTATSIARATDSLLPLSDITALEIAVDSSLRLMKIKDYKNNKDSLLEYALVSHHRTASSPVHQWLKTIILKLGQEISQTRDEKLGALTH